MAPLSRRRHAALATRTANDLAPAAERGLVDMRAGRPVRAGAYTYLGPALATDWHSHDLHQLEYACEGAVDVETATARFLLPPHQAAWIPAGLRHCSRLGNARTISVFFEPSAVGGESEVRIVAVPPLMREMITYAVRWPIDRPTSDPIADAYFAAMAALVPEWLGAPTLLRLPVSAHPVVAAAMAYTQAHLDAATPARMCRELGTSERTLRRLFAVEAGMTWRTYLGRARMLQAIALLARPDTGVLDVAVAVGYDSATSFTRAFTRFTGSTPSDYRRTIA